MTEPVLFPDATALVVNYLRTCLSAYRGATVVAQNVPNPRPTDFVTVYRTGGPRVSLVADAAQVTVDSWADRDEDASDLSQAARAFVNAMRGTLVDGVAVYEVSEFSGPADLPDPLSNQSRYRQSFSVTFRGTALPS